MFYASCSADKTAKIWNIQDPPNEPITPGKALIGHKMWIWDAAFTNDGKFIITCSSDHSAKLWNTETGRIDRNFTSAHNKGITALALTDAYA